MNSWLFPQDLIVVQFLESVTSQLCTMVKFLFINCAVLSGGPFSLEILVLHYWIVSWLLPSFYSNYCLFFEILWLKYWISWSGSPFSSIFFSIFHHFAFCLFSSSFPWLSLIIFLLNFLFLLYIFNFKRYFFCAYF